MMLLPSTNTNTGQTQTSGIKPAENTNSSQTTNAKTVVHNNAEKEAFRALYDMQVVVRTGVSFRDYGGYLIKCKQDFDAAKRSAAGNTVTPFWIEAEAAISDYEFTSTAWEWKFSGDGVEEIIRDNDQLGQMRARLILTYYPDHQFLWMEPRQNYDGSIRPGYWFTSIDSVLQSSWEAASIHIQRVESL